jgi:hypothetical protein
VETSSTERFFDRSNIPFFTRILLKLRSRQDQVEVILSHALCSSEQFILIASREAANSHWVNFEVETWLKLRPQHLPFIVLIDGKIVSCDDDSDKIDWSKTDALPVCLRGALYSMPLFVDLRGDFHDYFRSPNEMRRATAMLVAAIERMPFSVIEDIDRHRRWW